MDKNTAPTSTINKNPINNQKSKIKSVNIVNPLDKNQNKNIPMWIATLITILIISLGTGTGYLLANNSSTLTSKISNDPTNPVTNQQTNIQNSKKEAGIKDEQIFPDSTEGMLEQNDGTITTEGTHMLIREGGPDKTAFLTSSTVDLSLFEGKQVMVMGQTFASQTAGWLMDVGYIKVIE